ncbi:MAG: hypothetical protein U1D30_06655 [Planctomycetota bacterium]
MLWLLGQLVDAEIIILRGRLSNTNESREKDRESLKKHGNILTPNMINLSSTEDELEEEAIKASYKQHLLDLGLLRNVYQKPNSKKAPELDPNTGTLKVSRIEITR